MKWRFEEYRKLYVREAGSFLQLPLYCRALAGELLKLCDDAGHIALGGRDPAAAIAFALGATKQDRALLRLHVPLLLQDEYMRVEGDHLVVSNFVEAQRRHRHDDPQLAEAQAAPRSTSGRLADDLRQGTGEDAADLRRGSVGQVVEIVQHPISTPDQAIPDQKVPQKRTATAPSGASAVVVEKGELALPGMGAALSVVANPTAPAAADTKRPPKRSDSAPPFTAVAALSAIAEGAKGNFLVGEERAWDGGHKIATHKRIRQFPDLAIWRRVGAWLGAGGLDWRQSTPTIAWVASADFSTAVVQSDAWDKAGRGPVQRANSNVRHLSNKLPAAPVSTSFTNDDAATDALLERMANTGRHTVAGGSR